MIINVNLAINSVEMVSTAMCVGARGCEVGRNCRVLQPLTEITENHRWLFSQEGSGEEVDITKERILKIIGAGANVIFTRDFFFKVGIWEGAGAGNDHSWRSGAIWEVGVALFLAQRTREFFDRQRAPNPPLGPTLVSGCDVASLSLPVFQRKSLILTTKGIDDVCMKYMVEAGVIGVRRCKKDDLKRIAFRAAPAWLPSSEF